MLWHSRAYEQPIKLGWQRLSAAVRAHRVALALLAAACVVGQIFALSTSPLVVRLSDTPTYLAVTHNILASGQFFDAWRSPGYPTLLALVFLLTAGQHLAAVVVVQIALMLVTTVEIYVLTYRIAHSRWQACLVAVLCALNPFVIAWEHTVTTETLSYWLCVTLFLVFERYLRRGTHALLGGLAALLVALILTRPQFVFLPLLLAVVLVVWRWRLGARSGWWRGVGIVGVVPCLLILAYCVGNAAATGYFGLSDVASVSLFGKVIEYHMFDQAGPGSDARFVQFRTAVHAAETTWDHSPSPRDSWHVEGFVWTFVDQHPEFDAQGRAVYGAYSTAIIMHHPLEYARDTLPDVIVSTYAAPIYFAAPGYTTPRTLWLAPLFTMLSRIAAFLPLVLLFAAWSVWRRPRDATALLVLTLLLALSTTVVLGAFTDFAEFWRIRFPLDWIMLVAIVPMLVSLTRSLAASLAQARPQRSQSTRHIAHKAP